MKIILIIGCIIGLVTGSYLSNEEAQLQQKGLLQIAQSIHNNKQVSFQESYLLREFLLINPSFEKSLGTKLSSSEITALKRGTFRLTNIK